MNRVWSVLFLPLVVFAASRVLLVLGVSSAIAGMPLATELAVPQPISDVAWRVLERSVSLPLGSPRAGFVVASLVFVLALVLFDRMLVSEGHDEETRWRALFYLCTFPPMLFLTARDLLLLPLAVAAFWYLGRRSGGASLRPILGGTMAVTVVVAASALSWDVIGYLAMDVPIFVALARWGRLDLVDRTVSASFCVLFGLLCVCMARGGL